MTSIREQALAETDWSALAGDLDAIRSRLYDERGSGDWTAEALRELLSRPRCGFTANAEVKDLIEAHGVVDRGSRERAEQECARLRAEVQRLYAEARSDIAADLRSWCNERTVPARLRREGVLLAADRLDGGRKAGAT